MMKLMSHRDVRQIVPDWRTTGRKQNRRIQLFECHLYRPLWIYRSRHVRVKRNYGADRLVRKACIHHRWLALRKIWSVEDLENPAGAKQRTPHHRSPGGERHTRGSLWWPTSNGRDKVMYHLLSDKRWNRFHGKQWTIFLDEIKHIKWALPSS